MIRRLATSALLAAATLAAAGAPAAHASCADAVEVDGLPLYGSAIDDERLLPATTGPHPAIRPACGDTRARGVSVRRLAGLPPQVAVASPDRRILYRSRDTLPQIAGHPLREAVYRGRLPARPRGCRTDAAPLLARAVDVRVNALRVDVGDSSADIGVDGETRITNRAAFTPVRPGQRLSMRTVTCGERRVADRMALIGSPPRAGGTVIDGVEGREDPGTSPYVIPAVLVGAGLIFVVGVGLALLIPTARRRRPR